MNQIVNSKSTSIQNASIEKSSVLSAEDFSRMSNLLYSKTGITLTSSKRSLMEGRIRKRLRFLGIYDTHQYCEYLFSKIGQHNELEGFINAMTTNKTDFMREFGHFQYLIDHVLPKILRTRKQLRFWSAACSRGAEPYTLAMVLEEYARTSPIAPSMSYQIQATDIDTQVLIHAKNALYEEDDIEPVPMEWRKRYLLRGKGEKSQIIRINSYLRNKVQFQQLNLMDSFPWSQPFDVIFCRNVTIYFDRETQNRLVRKFLEFLKPDGYLIMGHSESLDVQVNPIKLCAPSIYQRIIHE